MKVILNSDVLYHGQLVVDKLSNWHEQLFKACADRGHTVVIPLTTLLEFNRQQSKLHLEQINSLNNAYATLDRHGIQFNQIEPSKRIKKPDLISMIRNLGVNVELVEPTYDDFTEAHKRACLHEAPHPNKVTQEKPGKKEESDEMRDLVIWVIAVRLATQDSGALLISRDTVHVNSRGNDEARKVGLERIKSIDEALEYFYVLTPAGKLIKRLLLYIWDDLLEAGLPFSDPMSIASIIKPRFIQGTRGPSSANCEIRANGSDNNIVEAVVRMKLDRGDITQVSVSNVLVNKGKWNEGKETIIEMKKTTNIWPDDYKQRLNALKATLGGES